MVRTSIAGSSAALALSVLTMSAIGRAQQPPAPQPTAAAPAAGGRMIFTEPAPFDFSDHTGYVSLFDGVSLKGWDGNPKFWRVENGAIVGESTPEKKVNPNTFMIWRGGEPKDFELKVEFKLNATNSGIQYRSVELKDVAQWVLKGYQADIDFDNQYTGQIYEERGRGFLALRGQAAYVTDGQPSRAVGTLESGDALKALIKQNDWNQVHIIARGSTLIHMLNGHVMSVVIDDDPDGRRYDGLLGVQVHVGPPMKIEYRNFRLKRL